ncbi:MAG TPA: winged helix-turn-helix domain-containing protein [Solirubrobacteraceae bacterium]|nr:winged helix-turn-helix domain-containing protein [Solirubrobacteraceae bacterium]
MSTWTFLTNHAHVLLCIARDPGIRLREVATEVGITERAAQRIVAELVEAGYISREREGRRNRYEVHDALPLRHPLEQSHEIGELLGLLGGLAGRPAASA